MQPERRIVWKGSTGSADAPLTPKPLRGPKQELCRILVVDDDVLVRAQLCALLHASGYEVETAAAGDDALELLRTSPCDIVVTDWHMPRMDGMALCRQLRATEDQAYVFLLMLTVKQSPRELLAGFAAGVDDYVVKGTPSAELLARLEKGRRIAHWRSSRTKTETAMGKHCMIDSDTGTYNLQYLMRHLPRELARSRRHDHSLALLSCEIDRIAPDNEQSGPVTEEALARSFALCSTASLRESDWMTRTGIHEFMVVLPETDREGAQCVARKLRDAFARQESGPDNRHGGGVSIQITAFGPQDAAEGTAQVQELLDHAQLLQDNRKPMVTLTPSLETMHFLSDLDLEDAKGGRDWPTAG